MRHIDPAELATAFLHPGTPMLSDVMQRVASNGTLGPARQRDILSGLRRVAHALGRPAEEIPADARWLQKRLEHIQPAALGLSAKSWSNIRSDAKAGMVLCGVMTAKINRKAKLSPAWQGLWQVVLNSGDPTIPKAFPRFMYFLNRYGIDPAAVRFEHAVSFREAVEMNEISHDPEHAFRTAVNAWNLAVNRFPEWPRQTFPLPSRAKVIKRPPGTFPDSFVRDLEGYLSGRHEPDIFGTDGIGSPLKPATIEQYRAMLLRFASILLITGLPVEEIRDLAALVRIENAERGLRWMWTQKDKQKTLGTADMANLLRNVARRHVKVDEQHQRHLDKWNDNLAVRQPSGMTAKNRDRLRPLEDPDTLRRLLTLPDRLFERGVRGGDSLTAALEREDAIALAILIYCPIRRKNLFGIHLAHNLQRMGDGRAFLVFEAGEVKNRRRIEFALPSHVVTMIDAHLKTRCPRLCPPGTPWLFAQRDGTAAGNANYFCTKLKRRIAKEIGLTINPHLFRHIAAKIFLEAHPGQYEVVKRLLGHTALSQTLNAYAGFEAGSSVRLFASVVEKARRT